MSKKRLIEIDRSKGLAIILVVIGHFADQHSNHYTPNWYLLLKDLIYNFHMPFFMFLSGLVVAYSQANISSVRVWGRFVRKKFWRLIPAYLMFGCIVFVGKMALQKIFYVDHANLPLISIFNFIISPLNSHVQFLWYIYVLFEMCCIYPVIIWGIRKNSIIILSVALFLLMLGTYIDVSDFLGIDLVCRMFLFFVLGVMFSDHYEVYMKIIDNYLFLFVGMFFVTLLLRAFIDFHFIITSVFAIPALLGIVKRWESRMLNVFGKYCFSIYLMNLIFIGLTKGVALRLFTLPDPSYTLLFLVCCVSGLCLPVLLKKYVFISIGWLDRITD